MSIEPLYILLQLLFLMLCLILIGEPLRVVISRFCGFFKNLDVLQKSTLNVYLGGLILYAVAMVPLDLFSATVAWVILIAFGVLSIFLHLAELGKVMEFMRLKKERVHQTFVYNYLLRHKTAVLECTVTFAMFLSALWIQILPLPNFVFGSVHDTSLHALFTELILENKQVPLTMQPYLPEGIIYPQAAHVLFAYACYILGYSSPKAVFYVTALFQASIILGAYYLGRGLSSRHLGVSLAFVFFCVSRWPRLLIWGSNSYIVAFPLQFISLSLVPLLIMRTQGSSGRRISELLAIGVLFGYLAALHLTLYFVLAVAAFIMVLVSALRRRHLYALKNLLVAFGLSLIPISPYIYRFIWWFPYPGHNIGLPSDVSISPFTPVNLLDWYLFAEGISPHYPLVAETIGLIIISGVILYKMRGQLTRMLNTVNIALCSLTASAILFLLWHLQYVVPSFTIVMGEATRPAISILVSLCFCIGIFNVMLFDMLTNRFRKKLIHFFSVNKNTLANMTGVLLALSTFSLIYLPFIYYTVAHDVEYLAVYYGKFSVTTSDDYELMIWMRDNLDKDAVILVNTYEPGTFIPSVAHLKVVYPFVASRESQSYKKLNNMIQQGILNTEVIDIIRRLNVTYVYVGSNATYSWENNHKWNSQIFLSNPNFKLIKEVGDAYLFEVL